jgi:hypothetical protein
MGAAGLRRRLVVGAVTLGGLTVNENQFTQRVVDTAKLYGWLVTHFRPAETGRGWRTPLSGDAGFVDLVLARAGEVLHAELKVGRNKPSPAQVSWGAALGGTYRLWYPDDWDEIVETLRTRRPSASAAPVARSPLG